MQLRKRYIKIQVWKCKQKDNKFTTEIGSYNIFNITFKTVDIFQSFLR